MKRWAFLTVLAALTVMAVAVPGYAGGDDLIDLMIRNAAPGSVPRYDLVPPETDIQRYDNLGLSDEQKARMKAVVEARNKALADVQDDKDGKYKAAWAALHEARARGDDDAIAKATATLTDMLTPLHEMLKKSQANTMNVLTPEQKAAWDKARAQPMGGLERYRDALGVTDEEWKALAPLLKRVLSLRLQAGLPANGYAGDREFFESDSNKAQAALLRARGKQDATSDELKAALGSLRDARARARVELQKAEKELKAVLTVRQEAKLVALGVLE